VRSKICEISPVSGADASSITRANLPTFNASLVRSTTQPLYKIVCLSPSRPYLSDERGYMNVIVSSITSASCPVSELTIERDVRRRAFIRDDLPTFGRPLGQRERAWR